MSLRKPCEPYEKLQQHDESFKLSTTLEDLLLRGLCHFEVDTKVSGGMDLIELLRWAYASGLLHSHLLRAAVAVSFLSLLRNKEMHNPSKMKRYSLIALADFFEEDPKKMREVGELLEIWQPIFDHHVRLVF